MAIPSAIFHYYDAAQGPNRSLTHLPLAEAEGLLEKIRLSGVGFAAQRPLDYLKIRLELEEIIRTKFIQKGGKPRLLHPYYFILGACEWVKQWYHQGSEIQYPLSTIPTEAISFTYGDSFPAMRYQDGKPYRGQVYTLPEIAEIISEFGLPQNWNPQGKLGPERYIEAQVWVDLAELINAPV